MSSASLHSIPRAFERMWLGSHLSIRRQVEGLHHQGPLLFNGVITPRLLARGFSLFRFVFLYFFLLLVLVPLFPEFAVISAWREDEKKIAIYFCGWGQKLYLRLANKTLPSPPRSFPTDCTPPCAEAFAMPVTLTKTIGDTERSKTNPFLL